MQLHFKLQSWRTSQEECHNSCCAKLTETNRKNTLLCFVSVLLFCNWTTLQETRFFISLSYYNSLLSCSSFIYTKRISDLLFYIQNKNSTTKDFKGFNQKGVSELLVMIIAPNMIILDNAYIFWQWKYGHTFLLYPNIYDMVLFRNRELRSILKNVSSLN